MHKRLNGLRLESYYYAKGEEPGLEMFNETICKGCS